MTVLTLDIGGTKIAAAIVTGDGRVGVRQLAPTPASAGADAVIAAAVTLGRRAAQGYAVERVGVSAAGVVDSATGVITHATDLISNWSGTALGARLAEAFEAPTRCLNDVHAHALGEAVYGAGRGQASMLLVAVGTGIGGAQVIDSEVVVGARGAAGHLGHVSVAEAAELPCSCGRLGHLEAVASGSGTLTAYRRRGGQAINGADLDRQAGRPGLDGQCARDVLATAGRATGRVIGSLLNVLDPALVVLSGGMTRAAQPWLSALRDGVALSAMDVVAATPIVLAVTGDDAPHLGAAHFATHVATRFAATEASR